MDSMYDPRRAIVLGLGVSGEAAAGLLLSRGCQVTVLDEGDGVAAAAGVARIRTAGGTVLLGKRPLPDDPFELCVASPAFAIHHPWILASRDRGIPIRSELEFGAAYWKGRILAITGSKGKSSLVKLCSDTLNQAGVRASPAGNYGIPLSHLVLAQPDLDWAVVEVSSFQMEHSPGFHPQIGILLNLQPDHLDRHADLLEYKTLKFRMFANMHGEDLALLPSGLETGTLLPAAVPMERFGVEAASEWRYEAGRIVHRTAGLDTAPLDARGTVSIKGTWFDNDVLGIAAAAATAALLRAGLSVEQIQRGFACFQPLAHRVQKIGTDARGVTWIDDSKATSLTATAAALKMVRKPVRLIAGGLLKENDLDFIKELLTQTTQKVYLIGQCAEKMAEAWASVVSCEIYETIDRAVRAAAQESQSDETVLLSPGTASFDQFNSYRERGERFTQLVRAVANL